MNSDHPSNPPSRESSASSGTTGDASDGKSSQIMIPTPNELVSLLSKRVIGQEQAKQTIAVAVYQHFMNCARSDLLGGRVEVENNVLLIGPTGCGKSLLLRTLQDLLEIPLFTVSCTNITPDGYKGKNFVQHLDSIAEVIIDEGQTSPAIVVWDECDKLSIQGHHGEAAYANVYRRITQMDFLTYLDGSKCGSEVQLDSSRILNIAMGAFVGMDAIRNPATRPEVGFHGAMASCMGSLPPVAAEHLVTYGLIPEFVGRFSRISTLDSLDHSGLRRVLTEAQDNVMARRKDFFALHGVRLEITDDALDELVSKALLQGTGARALRVVVDQMLRGVEHRLPEMAAQGIRALIYDRNAVSGLSAPIEHKDIPAISSQLLAIRRHASYATQGETPEQEDDDLCIF